MDNISIDITYTTYQEFIQEKTCDYVNIYDCIVVLYNLSQLYPNLLNEIILNNTKVESARNSVIESYKRLYTDLKKSYFKKVMWFGFEDYNEPINYVTGNINYIDGLVDNINYSIMQTLDEEDVFIDLKRIIASIGIDEAYSEKNKYRWNVPYSQKTINSIANEIYKQYLIEFGKTKKCLVLDCDNVLWGGVLSEDGIEKIFLDSSGLGRSFQEFQRFLLTLYYKGVLLAVCSKNNEADVLRVFKEHSGMILKEQHIACFKANWNNKADNIKEISQQLNIGLDSMIFIDDSDFEIQSVKSLLPEVVAIKYNRNNIFEKLSILNLKNNVNIYKIEQRNNTYKTNEKRQELKSQSLSFEDYIKSLEMKIDIHTALPSEFERIAELTQRTNKHTNGIRYTVNQLISNFQTNTYTLYSVSVSDKFSDLGIVGAVGIENNILDIFCLSCRALGRGIEKTMFDTASKHNIFKVNFKSTGKNHELSSALNKLIRS